MSARAFMHVHPCSWAVFSVCLQYVLTPTMMMCIAQEYESKAAEARAKQAARRGETAAEGDASIEDKASEVSMNRLCVCLSLSNHVSPSICVCMLLSCLSDCVTYMPVHLYVSMCPCASVLA